MLDHLPAAGIDFHRMINEVRIAGTVKTEGFL
jgi:hypothetical protein